MTISDQAEIPQRVEHYFFSPTGAGPGIRLSSGGSTWDMPREAGMVMIAEPRRVEFENLGYDSRVSSDLGPAVLLEPRARVHGFVVRVVATGRTPLQSVQVHVTQVLSDRRHEVLFDLDAVEQPPGE